MTEEIKVTSHVSRDVLSNSEVFKNERQVVWEYVANALQYVDPGVMPRVMVKIDGPKKSIEITDNGRGMDKKGFDHFFTMHGENLERKAGRGGRGRFGTGKSAAFAIAESLTIESVCNGKRTEVNLTRAALKEATDGDEVPVKVLQLEEATDSPNGTKVTIGSVWVRRMDRPGVVRHLEQQISRWGRGVQVFVNEQICEYVEPPIERALKFRPPEGEIKEILGDVELIVNVAKSPVPAESRGIAIYSKGSWFETTLVGLDGKDRSELIFGEFDVPAIDEDDTLPAAFDLSRAAELNPENRVVQAIRKFIGPILEDLIKELQVQHAERKKDEDYRRLQEEAAKIESIINDDYSDYHKRLQAVRASGGIGFDHGPESESTEDGIGGEVIASGGEVPATVISDTGSPGALGDGESNSDGPPRRLNPTVGADPEGESLGQPQQSARKPAKRGGFTVEFENQGAGQSRASYEREKRVIYINLDHPQLAAAIDGRDPQDPVFKRLAYEVAFSEYSIALASELEASGEFIDLTDPIFEIRETLNRIALAGAGLYAI